MNYIFYPIDRYLSSNVTYFTFEMTQQCNFRCGYCCYSGHYRGMRTHSEKDMSRNTLIGAINYVKKHAKEQSQVFLSFFGGEALLRKNEIDYTLRNLKNYFGNNIIFDLSTNGSLLSDDNVDWICSYDNLNISVSIDGCKEVHDKNRKFANGQNTYDLVYENLLRFKQQRPKEYGERVKLLLTIGSLKDIELIGNSFPTFEPIIGNNKIFISHIIPNIEKKLYYRDSYEDKLLFCDTAIAHYNEGRRDIYTILLEELLDKTKYKGIIEKQKKIPLGTCLNDMYSTFISSDGLLYACEKFGVNQSIGDIWHGIDIKLAKKLSIKYSLRKSIICGDCPVIEYCNRCISDLKMTIGEMRFICQDMKENIKLSLYCKSRIISKQ